MSWRFTRTGISYRRTYNSRSSSPIDEIVGETNISSASVENFRSADSEDLLNSLKKAVRTDFWGKILLFISIYGFIFGFLSIWCLIGGGILFVGSLALIIVAHSVLRVTISYDMNEETQNAHNKRIAQWEKFFSSKVVWQIVSTGYYTRAKVHGGANVAVTRLRIKRTKTLPFYLKTNSSFIYIKLQKEELIILPDKMLIRKRCKFGSLNYDDVHIYPSTSNFIDDCLFLPGDATKIGDTWQYVNKNGSPDRRFNNNRLIPICLYGYLDISSNSGLNIRLSCSNCNNVSQFQ